jgi:hypothetical protein
VVTDFPKTFLLVPTWPVAVGMGTGGTSLKGCHPMAPGIFSSLVPDVAIGASGVFGLRLDAATSM